MMDGSKCSNESYCLDDVHIGVRVCLALMNEGVDKDMKSIR